MDPAKKIALAVWVLFTYKGFVEGRWDTDYCGSCREIVPVRWGYVVRESAIVIMTATVAAGIAWLVLSAVGQAITACSH